MNSLGLIKNYFECRPVAGKKFQDELNREVFELESISEIHHTFGESKSL